jgi:LAO/AO transport system kinase
VEISGLADTTIVVFVPEAGDEVQTMKSGVMEIADIFVVNKSDREGADIFAGNLEKLVHSHGAGKWVTPVIKVSATRGSGIEELIRQMEKHQHSGATGEKKNLLVTEKVYRLIRKNRMKDINKAELQHSIKEALLDSEFNIYKFADSY